MNIRVGDLFMHTFPNGKTKGPYVVEYIDLGNSKPPSEWYARSYLLENGRPESIYDKGWINVIFWREESMKNFCGHISIARQQELFA